MATNNSINSLDPIQIALGGTGNSSLTAHSVLVGEGTSAITPLTVGTNGQVLIGSTGADPAFATLTSTGGSITYTTGANSLNLDLNNFTSGSFSPTLAFGGGSTGITYTTNSGFFLRIGSLVIYSMYIVLSSKGSSTGAATITTASLPYTPGNTATTTTFGSVSFTNQLISYVGGPNVTWYLQFQSTTGFGSITNSNFTNTSTLYISGLYV